MLENEPKLEKRFITAGPRCVRAAKKESSALLSTNTRENGRDKRGNAGEREKTRDNAGE